MKYKQLEEMPKQGSKFEFNFKDVQTKNPKFSGKTPHYFYITDMVKWGKKKGIIK
jgi:hypothetical protein